MDKKNNNRKSNIELLRIIAMLMVIAHHYVYNTGIMDTFEIGSTSMNYIFLEFWGMWGKTAINVFILISGYFMCTSDLTIRRYCKVLFEFLFYNFGIYFVMLIAGFETIGLKRLFDLFFGIFEYANGSGNFEYSFFIFYLSIPFLNLFIRSITEAEYKKLVLFLIFVFSILSTFFLNNVIFGEVYWFIAVYFIGAYFKLYPPAWSENPKASIRLLIMSLVLAYASVASMIFVGFETHSGSPMYFLYDANKIEAVLSSVLLFVTFKNLNIGYSKVINIIAKTTFGVFLIHSDNSVFRHFIWNNLLHVDTYYSLPLFTLILRSILTVAGVFVFCSMIDMIRIFFIEKPVFDHFNSFEKALIRIWGSFTKICYSIYRRIIGLAER